MRESHLFCVCVCKFKYQVHKLLPHHVDSTKCAAVDTVVIVNTPRSCLQDLLSREEVCVSCLQDLLSREEVCACTWSQEISTHGWCCPMEMSSIIVTVTEFTT